MAIFRADPASTARFRDENDAIRNGGRPTISICDFGRPGEFGESFAVLATGSVAGDACPHSRSVIDSCR